MKPTIYLGIGGTGNKAIAYAKKHYEEEYGVGNIPSEVAFVGFDFQTDMDKSPDLATDISANFIKVDSDSNPQTFYEVGKTKKNKFQWMFEGNSSNIDALISKGANQVRTTGRLYTEMTLALIIPKIKQVINQILHVSGTAANVKGGVNIYMVMSLAGGTGAGSFLTIASAIKQEYGNRVNLYGYGVTHGVFEAMDPMGNKMPNVMYNCISSIVDIDYLFTASEQNPIKFELDGNKVELKSPIFDNFFIVDNQSEGGYGLTGINEVCEMLGLCLYSYGGDAGSKVEAVLNNVNHKKGYYNVESKLGWAMGVGACQVVYKGQLLAEVYGIKAAIELIRKMRQEEAGIQDKVMPWIEEVGLREDNINDENIPHDQLTDAICAPATIKSLKLPSIDQANSDEANKQECQKYLANLGLFSSDKQIANLLEGFKTKLDEKVQALLKENAAVGNTLKFVELFKTYCERFKAEMDAEVEELTKQKNDRAEAFEKKAYNDYISEKYGPFTMHRAEKNQELLEQHVSYPAREIMKLSYEIKRREVASSIYNTLITQADALCKQLENLDGNLKLIAKSLETALVQKQMKSSSLVFEYDLSTSERQNMKIDEDDIMVTSFVATLNNQSLLSIDSNPLQDVDIDEIIQNKDNFDTLYKKMLDYTMRLPQANNYKDILVTQVIEELGEKEYEKMKLEIEKISARWLRVDDKGEVTQTGKLVSDTIARNWIVSFYAEDDVKTRLEKDTSFAKNVLSKDYLPTTSSCARQRILFSCVDGCIIPYCIASLNDILMRRYDELMNKCKIGQAVFNPHCDKQLFERMREEDFKLKPEMQDEAMFYWVCAQLFGVSIVEKERIMQKDANGNVIKEEGKEENSHTKLVAYIGGKYMYWDEKSKSGKNQKWQVLGNTTKRDKAFNVFKTEVLPDCKEDLKRLILAEYQKHVATWEGHIASLKSANNGGTGSLEDYIDRIVCSDKSSATYYAQNGGELKLLQDEYDYLEQKLINQLALLK